LAAVVRLEKGNEEKAIEEAVKVLQKGGIIVYPTETCYGLGADALNEKAVEKVHLAKRQPREKPISVIAGNEKQAGEIAELDENARKLIHNFMPGPLTLVCEKKEVIPEVLTKDAIAFRIPGNEFARELAEKFGHAITATSANIHGEPAIYSAKEAEQKLGRSVDLIVDAGELPKREASTIYDLINKRIIREGPISEGQIVGALK